MRDECEGPKAPPTEAPWGALGFSKAQGPIPPRPPRLLGEPSGFSKPQGEIICDWALPQILEEVPAEPVFATRAKPGYAAEPHFARVKKTGSAGTSSRICRKAQ